MCESFEARIRYNTWCQVSVERLLETSLASCMCVCVCVVGLGVPTTEVNAFLSVCPSVSWDMVMHWHSPPWGTPPSHGNTSAKCTLPVLGKLTTSCICTQTSVLEGQATVSVTTWFLQDMGRKEQKKKRKKRKNKNSQENDAEVCAGSDPTSKPTKSQTNQIPNQHPRSVAQAVGTSEPSKRMNHPNT